MHAFVYQQVVLTHKRKRTRYHDLLEENLRCKFNEDEEHTNRTGACGALQLAQTKIMLPRRFLNENSPKSTFGDYTSFLLRCRCVVTEMSNCSSAIYSISFISWPTCAETHFCKYMNEAFLGVDFSFIGYSAVHEVFGADPARLLRHPRRAVILAEEKKRSMIANTTQFILTTQCPMHAAASKSAHAVTE